MVDLYGLRARQIHQILSLSFPPPLSLISLSYPLHFSVAIAKNQIFASIIERERRESRKCVGCFFIVTKNERIRQTWISFFTSWKHFFEGCLERFLPSRVFTASFFINLSFHFPHLTLFLSWGWKTKSRPKCFFEVLGLLNLPSHSGTFLHFVFSSQVFALKSFC